VGFLPGSLVGIDPQLADILRAELLKAEAELRACAAEVASTLAEVGDASFLPAEVKQIAVWCAEEAADVARRAAAARCGPTLAGTSAPPHPPPLGAASATLLSRGVERLVNVPKARLGEILITPPAPKLNQPLATPPAARRRQVLGNPGAPRLAKSPCPPRIRQGPVREISSAGGGGRPDGIARPSRSPNPSAKPRGPLTKVNPKEALENRRALNRENRVPEILAEAGYELRRNPQVPGDKNPDYLIEGLIFDNYAPSTPTVRSIWSTVEEKIQAGQTERVVIDLADTSVQVPELRRQFQDWSIPGLKQVLVIDQSGRVIELLP
jgi:hypothetical protein